MFHGFSFAHLFFFAGRAALVIPEKQITNQFIAKSVVVVRSWRNRGSKLLLPLLDPIGAVAACDRQEGSGA